MRNSYEQDGRLPIFDTDYPKIFHYMDDLRLRLELLKILFSTNFSLYWLYSYCFFFCNLLFFRYISITNYICSLFFIFIIYDDERWYCIFIIFYYWKWSDLYRNVALSIVLIYAYHDICSYIWIYKVFFIFYLYIINILMATERLSTNFLNFSCKWNLR